MSYFNTNKRALGIGTRIAVITFIMVGAVFGIYTAVVGYANAQLVETRALAEVTSKNRAVLDMTELFDNAVTDEAARFARVLAGNFSGKFSIDGTNTMDVAGKPAPVLKIGDAPINMDFTIPDRFTAQTDATATVFVASGEEFIRISTSVKKENGERDRHHPGPCASGLRAATRR